MDIEAKLERFSTLKAGWHGPHSKPIAPECIDAALRLIGQLDPLGLPQPQFANAEHSGGVHLGWTAPTRTWCPDTSLSIDFLAGEESWGASIYSGGNAESAPDRAVYSRIVALLPQAAPDTPDTPTRADLPLRPDIAAQFVEHEQVLVHAKRFAGLLTGTQCSTPEVVVDGAGEYTFDDPPIILFRWGEWSAGYLHLAVNAAGRLAWDFAWRDNDSDPCSIVSGDATIGNALPPEVVTMLEKFPREEKA